MNQGYTGCDRDCEAGEGSGYGYDISLECDGKDGCGCSIPLGHIKNYGDFSVVGEDLRAFNKGNM